MRSIYSVSGFHSPFNITFSFTIFCQQTTTLVCELQHTQSTNDEIYFQNKILYCEPRNKEIGANCYEKLRYREQNNFLALMTEANK